MESAMRSFTKALLWNVIGFVSMSIVGLIATGSLAVGGMMAITNTVIGFACYFLYERVWSRISWGRYV